MAFGDRHPVDGAVILDFGGRCYAIGAILDGMATKNGNPARGARYNSALRYVEMKKQQGKDCIAVVVSEDGTVDVLPEPENEDERNLT
ncbi:MAG TPA: DNA integrity scanning protein DisA nucleotide-binding domain protein [Candidatus Brocadiia bacterium]|nr:DNA integrity scanning protein DisA nucleotide-binding domain protein [Candidatus Brocadiia bacterium]